MRYWNFDVANLIKDYPKNQKTLNAVQKELKAARKFAENPIGKTTKADWDMMIKILELREAEYIMYTDMVILGFSDLPEVERLVLKLWLIEDYDDEYIVNHTGIKNRGELAKIKKLSLTRFANITMPD